MRPEKRIKVELSAEMWRSVEQALRDYLRFGPGDFSAEYVPDEHLEKAAKAINHRLASANLDPPDGRR